MENLIVRIHNSETNEVNDREMTSEEVTQWENKKAEIKAAAEAEATKAAEKAALLAKLGITADEAKLLLS